MKNKIVVITTLLTSLIFISANKTQAEEAKASNFFVGANAGVFKNFSAFNNDFQFDFGGKAGARIVNIEGFSQFWAALAYNHTSANPSGAITTGVSDLMLQPLFMNVGGSGFYFGPQVGFTFVTLGVSSNTEVDFGLLAGYMMPLTESLSLSPEANLTHFSNFGESQTALKLLVGLNYSF